MAANPDEFLDWTLGEVLGFACSASYQHLLSDDVEGIGALAIDPESAVHAVRRALAACPDNGGAEPDRHAGPPQHPQFRAAAATSGMRTRRRATMAVERPDRTQLTTEGRD